MFGSWVCKQWRYLSIIIADINSYYYEHANIHIPIIAVTSPRKCALTTWRSSDRHDYICPPPILWRPNRMSAFVAFGERTNLHLASGSVGRGNGKKNPNTHSSSTRQYNICRWLSRVGSCHIRMSTFIHSIHHHRTHRTRLVIVGKIIGGTDDTPGFVFISVSRR